MYTKPQDNTTKKINGKFYYFGTDPAAAELAYCRLVDAPHTGKSVESCSGPGQDLTLATLCSLYLDAQETRLLKNEIGPQHYYDQKPRLAAFAKALGPKRQVSEISTLDLLNYRADLIRAGNKRNTINNHLHPGGSGNGVGRRCVWET